MKTRLLLLVILAALIAVFWRLSQPVRPDPRLIALAVRATVYALPTPTPYLLEVTRVVLVTPTPTSTLTPTVTPIPTSTPEPISQLPEPQLASPDTAAAASVAVADVAEEVVEAAAAGEPAPAELPAPSAEDCPATSTNQYTTVPIAGGGLQHPDGSHADLNLGLRGYVPVNATRGLFNKDGPVDGDPPQLAGIFNTPRLPPFGATYRVYDWDWQCGEHGCRSQPLDHVQVTLLTLDTARGEAVGIPHRRAQVYGGGYKAMVLYAEATRITLGYTRDDTVANGYTVHIENVCVDPILLAIYAGSTAAGRAFLPALREEQVLGTAHLGDILVAVRDRGVFFDPRSRLDWWKGY